MWHLTTADIWPRDIWPQVTFDRRDIWPQVTFDRKWHSHIAIVVRPPSWKSFANKKICQMTVFMRKNPLQVTLDHFRMTTLWFDEFFNVHSFLIVYQCKFPLCFHEKQDRRYSDPKACNGWKIVGQKIRHMYTYHLTNIKSRQTD
jgi:hypothetical protein